MQNNEWKSVTDQEELFKLKRQGWEIQFKFSSETIWTPWKGNSWSINWIFQARPTQPKMKKVKLLCFYNGRTLFWGESGKGYAYTCRVPSEDKEIEIPDNG